MFQRDNACAHTSKATVAWLDANIKHCILPEDWPPNSPDLSPTENVWSIMATAVYAIDVKKNDEIKIKNVKKRKNATRIKTFVNVE